MSKMLVDALHRIRDRGCGTDCTNGRRWNAEHICEHEIAEEALEQYEKAQKPKQAGKKARTKTNTNNPV